MVDLDTQLTRTSRTFALAIPLLPEPTRREVTLAYLLFRIADTFEDATEWSAERSTDALRDFVRLLDDPLSAEAEPIARAWVETPPVENQWYVDLLGDTPGVLKAFSELSPRAQEIIRAYLQQTVHGMTSYVQRGGAASVLQLRDLSDLRDYCYVVAGLVGEMLTELFVLERPSLVPADRFLRERARYFGECLQLTNILKDADDDVPEGRSYLPKGVARYRVFELARQDLELAEEYVLALQAHGAPRGLVAFTALPALLASATLDRVEQEGPGAKITRSEVKDILAGMNRALDGGAPAIATKGNVRRSVAR